METELNKMSSEQIENAIIEKQQELNISVENLGKIQNAIRQNKIYYGDLKVSEFKAEEIIRRTKQDINNLEKIYKWRALRKERGY